MNTTENYYPVQGSQSKNIGIILFHAYTGTPNDVNLLARKVNRNGYDVLCPVFQGHGTDDIFDILNAPISSWQEDAKQALAFMVDQAYDSIMVFGLSLGGIIATWLLSQDQGQLKAGGMFNSPILPDSLVDLQTPFLAYARALYMSNNRLEQFVNDKKQIIDQHNQQMQALNDFRQAMGPNLTKINVPFFVAQSGQDELVDSRPEADFLTFINPNYLDYHFYPDNSHVITVNRNRQAFEQDLFEFLEQANQ